MNLLLWGCKNWSLRQDLLRHLKVFLHCCVWRILHISITDVREQHFRNKKVRHMSYDIPCVKNMIAARQLGFLGKVVRGPIDCPARRMLTACCQPKCKQGHPYLHNKDVIVRNLWLLFTNVPEVLINNYGSLKDWFQEASHESFWKQLIQCLLDSQAPHPARPTEWPPPRRQSPRGQPSPTPATDATEDNDDSNNNDTSAPPPVPSPPRRRPPPLPPPRHQPPGTDHARQDYGLYMVGRSLSDLFKVLGLGLGATETEVKIQYIALSCIYHPD
jgi:hypothetical protein